MEAVLSAQVGAGIDQGRDRRVIVESHGVVQRKVRLSLRALTSASASMSLSRMSASVAYPGRKVEHGIVVFAACVNVAIGVHTGGRVRAAPVLRPGAPGCARERAC